MNPIDKATFLKFFNDSGNVFDFTVSTFNTFCLESIGVELCIKYKLSKGKSLEAFSRECSEKELIKLYSDLICYYENNCVGHSYIDNAEKHNQFEKCKQLIEKYKNQIVSIDIPSIDKVSREYIQDISSRALKDIQENNFDSALTKSRTMIEEVFCFAIEKQNVQPSEKGDIVKLYNQVKDLYNMHSDKDVDKRINNLLSGINKIIESISEMRDKNSDAHGVGAKRINIKDYHARLYVNSAMTISEFILFVIENKLKKHPENKVSGR